MEISKQIKEKIKDECTRLHNLGWIDSNDELEGFEKGAEWAIREFTLSTDEGIKWVKASQRLPDGYRGIIFRGLKNKAVYIYFTGLSTDGKTVMFEGINDDIYISVDDLEWLDEPKIIKGYTEYTKEELEGFKKAFKPERIQKWDGICECGHKHSDHSNVRTVNITAGKCNAKGCNCKYFVHDRS